MKTSTPQTPKPPQPKSILLIGPPGGGKSTLLMQFPGLLILDCDSNLDGPENYIRKKLNSDLSYSYESINFDDEGKEVPVHLRYARLVEKLKDAKQSSFETVAIDSMTMINEYIIRKVLKDQGVEAMRPADWQPLKSHYWNLLVSGIRSLGKTTIVTCHEVILTEADPKVVMKEAIVGYRPSVQGGIADYFGAFFTDMWRCWSEPGVAGKAEFKLATVRSKRSELKNSMSLPPEISNPTYKELEPYLKGLK